MDKQNKSSHLWRCVKRSYNARCKTDVNDLMILDNQRMDHSQEPEQERTLQRQKLRQECKKRALEETTERPKKELITELRKRRNQRLTNYSQKRCHLSGSGKKKKIGSKKTSASKKKKTTQKL
jgi:hypothetical protein